MSPVDGANLLLGLVAIVAVVSTVWSMACLFWVTRRPRTLADHTPAGDDLQAAQGARRGARGEPAQLLPARLPVLPAPLRRGRRRRPGDRGGPEAAQREFPDHDAQLVVGCSGLRAQSQGREPGGDGPVPQARRDPDQRLERAGPTVLPPRDGLLPGRAGGRAGDATCSPAWARRTPARSWRTSSSTASSPAAWPRPSVLRVTCVVGKSMLMPVRALEAIGGFAAVRNLLAEDQVIGVRVRKAGYSIRLSHHVIENVNRRRSFQLVPEPPLALVQDPPPDGAAGVPGRADGQPGDGRAGLGVLGRVGDRLGRAALPGRPGHGARRGPDPLAARLVPQAAPSPATARSRTSCCCPSGSTRSSTAACNGGAIASSSAG